jgi:NADH-quinone oxidoreductase subunit N
MTTADLPHLLPLIVLAATALLIMVAITIRRHHATAAALSAVGLIATLAALVAASDDRAITPLLRADAFGRFYTGLIVTAALAVLALSYSYLQRKSGERREELYMLIVIATLGAVVLVWSTHFVALFLGLEILTIALYVLIAYLHERALPIEAGLKYLVLAAASAAFLLFGLALIYAELGTMQFGDIAASLAVPHGPRPLLVPGIVLVTVGIGFKLAVVPFHMWTPDVYQGAPAPVAAFVATVSKGAMFALMVRAFRAAQLPTDGAVAIVFAAIAIASMLVGNLLALLQRSVKRVLAYSSIAHLGYLLVAFLAGGQLGLQAAAFYLCAYFVTMLGAFGVLTVLSGNRREADDLEDLRGLFWTRPALATVFSAMLLSLAGIPLTAGFVGKFYLVAAGSAGKTWPLLVTLAVGSAIGIYYYLRVLITLYQRPIETDAPALPRITPAVRLTLGSLTVALLWFGVYPTPLVELIRVAMGR